MTLATNNVTANMSQNRHVKKAKLLSSAEHRNNSELSSNETKVCRFIKIRVFLYDSRPSTKTIVFNLTHFCLGHVVAKGKDEEASAHLPPMFLHNKVRFVATSFYRVIINGPDIEKFRFTYFYLVSHHAF